jgi:hypothetical protein
MIVPLDLVKCRMQVDAAKYPSLGQGFKVTVAEGGTRALGRGWAPTFIGYSMQGAFKFGCYEYHLRRQLPQMLSWWLNQLWFDPHNDCST